MAHALLRRLINDRVSKLITCYLRRYRGSTRLVRSSADFYPRYFFRGSRVRHRSDCYKPTDHRKIFEPCTFSREYCVDTYLKTGTE